LVFERSLSFAFDDTTDEVFEMYDLNGVRRYQMWDGPSLEPVLIVDYWVEQ